MESVFAKPLVNCFSSRFSFLKWLDTVTIALFKRPLVFMICMSLTGGYIAYYARPWSCVLLVLFTSGTMVYLLCARKQRIQVVVTILAGTVSFSALFIGVSVWKLSVSQLSDSESYDGPARVISPDASNDGFKNIVLQLENGEKVIYLSEDLFNYGDRLDISGTLTPIVTKGNPGDFDVRDYYLKKGICREIRRVTVIRNRGIGFSLINLGFKCGAYVRRSFYTLWRSCTDDQTASVMSAMIVGDDSHLEKELKTSFKKSNLAHILVVSGAHVGDVSVH